MAVMLFSFVMLFSVPSLFAQDPYTKFTQLNLPPGLIGPDSVALDRFGQGPYVDISDGRVLKYDGPGVGFVDFAYTAPNRTKEVCDGTNDPNLGTTCGRILALSFNLLTGVLYLADTFNGLYKVGPNGGRATLITTSAGGIPLNFLNSVDIDPISGDVYFTDGSLTFNYKNLSDPNLVRDASGRLIVYNPITTKITVLLEGLASPSGIAVSSDGSFVLVAEIGTLSIRKYWVRGIKRNTSEIILRVPGNPIKIKRASTLGQFWVPVNQIVREPPSVTPFGYKFDSYGKVLLIKNFQARYNNNQIQVVQEYSGSTLYVGSLSVPFVGIYSKP